MRFRPPPILTFALALGLVPLTPGRAQSDPGNFSSSPPLDTSLGNFAVRPQPVFFPPAAPPLGQAALRMPAAGGRSQRPAPAELAAHVGEPFYPMLGARLHAKELPPKLRAELDRYTAARTGLLAALRAELARTAPLASEERLAALTALARTQAPQLAALEQQAEQLRRDLNVKDLAWSALREWRLDDGAARGYSPREIGQVMRGAAFYADGLLPAQRRLLREIALELALAGENSAAAAAAQPHVFFDPEPARVLFPEMISAATAKQIADYETKKSALKKELYDTVHRHDGAMFGFLRGNPLKALAERQAGRLAELETLAEDIRRGLPPGTPAAPAARRSPLPPVLTARVQAMIRRYTAAQREAAATVDAVLDRARDVPLAVSYRFEADGLKFTAVPGRSARTPEATAQVAALRAELIRIAETYGGRLAELINERLAIRSEIGPALGTEDNAAIDRALLAAVRAETEQEQAAQHADYRVAVFEPGLAPAQRRLLFGGVLADLALPLPPGEPQPTRRSAGW